MRIYKTMQKTQKKISEHSLVAHYRLLSIRCAAFRSAMLADLSKLWRKLLGKR